MDDAKKLAAVRTMYAAVLADTTRQYGIEGVLEKVTARKKAEDAATGAAKAQQMGIRTPEQVFTTLSELFNCAQWQIQKSAAGFTATNKGCMLASLARKFGAPSPCALFCLNPMEGMVKGLSPDAVYEVKETLWEGDRCEVNVTA